MSRVYEQLARPYPRSPGFKEPTTSRDAAAAIAPRMGSLQASVLNMLATQPMTPDEAAAAIGCTVLAVRPRFSELSKIEKIVRTGERRANASGVKADVWRLA